MIGDERVVKNARLETKWTVRDDITKVECPEIDTHVNRPGVQGFDFKEVSVSRCKIALYELEDEKSIDTTLWHSRMSLLSQTDQHR